LLSFTPLHTTQSHTLYLCCFFACNETLIVVEFHFAGILVSYRQLSSRLHQVVKRLISLKRLHMKRNG